MVLPKFSHVSSQQNGHVSRRLQRLRGLRRCRVQPHGEVGEEARHVGEILKALETNWRVGGSRKF